MFHQYADRFSRWQFFRWHPLTQTSNMAMAAMPVELRMEFKLTQPWDRWSIEIDGLPMKNGGSFHGKLLNNQRVSMVMQQEPRIIGGTDSIYFWPMFQAYVRGYTIHTLTIVLTKRTAAKAKPVKFHGSFQYENHRGHAFMSDDIFLGILMRNLSWQRHHRFSNDTWT